MRVLLLVCLVSLVARAQPSPLERARAAAKGEVPDPAREAQLLVVDTQHYRLSLYARGRLLRTVEIGLGQARGPKQELHDLKTPRGIYFIVDKQRGEFAGQWGEFYGGHWIKINYPGPLDAARGLARGWIGASTAARITEAWKARALTPQGTRLGGGVGFHGWASEWDGQGGAHLSFGCVVLHNQDMAELFDGIVVGAMVVIFENRGVKRVLPWLVPLVVWSALVVALALRHELWRDEVRPLNLVAFSKTPWAILGNLRNEGHPPLWYLVLWLGTLGGRFYWMLKPIALLVGAGSAYLFVRHAPFPLWLRPLFLFGLYPLYEFTVMCRNYGLSLLLLLAIAHRWPRRWSRPLGLAGLLALLCNTNAHSLVLVGALGVALLAEGLVGRRWRECGSTHALLGLSLVVAGAWLAVLVMRPHGEVLVLKHPLDFSPTRLWRWSALFLEDPLRVCPELLGVTVEDTRGFAHLLDPTMAQLGRAVFVLVLVYLALRAWPLALALLFGWWGISLLGDAVYSLVPRHHGVAYGFLVALGWMAAATPSRLDKLLWPLLLATFLVQIRAAGTPAWTDYHKTLSAAPALGQFVAAHPELRAPAVIPEPEARAETLPYYLPGARIYLVHEGRPMQGRVMLSAENQKRISLDELLDAAERQSPPVLLLMGSVNAEDPLAGLERRVPATEASRQRFLGSTVRLGRFEAEVGDESYTLYQLRP